MTAIGANTLEPAADSGFFGYPRGLLVCFATELWERFSFYGVKCLLLLYLTKYHLFSDASVALASYTQLFSGLLYLGLGFALFRLLLSPLLKKMMRGIH